jgi:membrane fusion protein (multidrug efflux system)
MRFRPALLAAAVVLARATGAASAETALPVAQRLSLSPADLVTVQQGAAIRLVPVTGALEPLRRATVNARVGEVVEQVLVREGDSVKKGQVILRQNTDDLDAQLMQAQASLASAQVERRLAEMLEQKKTDLYHRNYLSRIDWETARSETEVKRALVKVQEARFAIAKKARAGATLTAPMAGIVAERTVQPGTQVLPGQPLMTIVDSSELELTASIPARDAPLIKVGGTVAFAVDGYAGREFQGRIVRINPLAGGDSRTLAVYALVDNGPGLLRGGMFAKGSVAVATGDRDTLRIPYAAVRRVDNRDQVFVVRGHELVLQPIVSCCRDAGTGLVEVTGLAAGEQVVLTPLGDRVSGIPVTISSRH